MRRRQSETRSTAAALRNLVDSAEEPASYWRARGVEPPLRSEAVLAARDDLVAVAQLLEADRAVPEPAVDCVTWLVWSAESPVCSDPVEDADVADIAGRLRRWLTAPV
jgi:hypothetical protein